MGKNNQMMSLLFRERKKFAVIGLTGRTGSGCTTAAGHLESGLKDLPDASLITHEGSTFFSGLDARRYKIIKKYHEASLCKFYSIKVSDLISAYLLSLPTSEAANFISNSIPSRVDPQAVQTTLESGSFSKTKIRTNLFKGILGKFIDHSKDGRLEKKEEEKLISFLKLIRKFTSDFKSELKKIHNELYIYSYQAAGNSIRKVGKISANHKIEEFSPDSVFHLPETINRVIKAIRKTTENALIVIDAIRNPFEASFFRDRYSAFYLISINAPDEDRRAYLQNVHKFNIDNLKEIDERESGKELSGNDVFTGQNVKKCIEMSDIHIFNPRNEIDNNNILKAQLAWYVSLMLHPGLVSPTAMERVMQLAYTARSNSGCISRQVGAAVTDEDFSVKAIGWNDVAKGQIPCSLRSLDSLTNDFDPIAFSSYERNNPEFRTAAKDSLIHIQRAENIKGRNLSYCFKDLKNSIDKKSNQVHTRSLHAEENAFLQLAKYGGPGIKGGKLFTTASPCELCAKKAYQLGIAEIFFIDPYPGIAKEHIIDVGSTSPKLVQFRGAVGHGYHRLYEPTINYKDELAYLMT